MSKLSWPKVGSPDFFTGQVGDASTNACLNWCADQYGAICTGYREAAEKLMKQVVKECRGQDTLVYPIMFLYRHYFELRIKEILHLGGQLLEREVEVYIHHKLMDLWRDARGMLREIEPDSPVETLDAVEEVLRRLDGVDPKSMSFRYAEGTKGEKLLGGLEQINLGMAREVLGSVVNFFECVSDQLNHFHESVMDMKADMKADMQDYV